ncbi:MAG: DUF47 domain-containing protein [Candidatus Wallbacteria bacterium]|nr:DUF47 domain-containing protein [Candidatus Wallbacteria bacterium]
MLFDRLIRALLPQEDKFFELLESGAVNLSEGARALQDFGKLSGDEERLVKSREIKAIEHKGDEITREIFEELVKSFVTPIEREDIIALASCIDDVLDAIEFFSDRIILYRVGSVGNYIPQMTEFIAKAVDRIETAMHLLRHMHRFDEIRQCALDIHKLETECDKLYHQALGQMFQEEWPPLEVIKFKEIYEDLEGAMDMCDDAGKVLANVVIRNG